MQVRGVRQLEQRVLEPAVARLPVRDAVLADTAAAGVGGTAGIAAQVPQVGKSVEVPDLTEDASSQDRPESGHSLDDRAERAVSDLELDCSFQSLLGPDEARKAAGKGLGGRAVGARSIGLALEVALVNGLVHELRPLEVVPGPRDLVEDVPDLLDGQVARDLRRRGGSQEGGRAQAAQVLVGEGSEEAGPVHAKHRPHLVAGPRELTLDVRMGARHLLERLHRVVGARQGPHVEVHRADEERDELRVGLVVLAVVAGPHVAEGLDALRVDGHQHVPGLSKRVDEQALIGLKPDRYRPVGAVGVHRGEDLVEAIGRVRDDAVREDVGAAVDEAVRVDDLAPVDPAEDVVVAGGRWHAAKVVEVAVSGHGEVGLSGVRGLGARREPPGAPR